MQATPTQRLFNLQLQIKKSIVNSQRNVDEIKRLRQTYEKQIKDFITSLYFSSRAIWLFSYNKVDAISKDTILVDGSVDVKTLFGDNVYANFFTQIRQNLPQIVSQDVSSNAHLSHACFQLVLASFKYLWSQEQVEEFAKFLENLDDNIKENLYICYLVHPLTQIYFGNCLRLIFPFIQSSSIDETTDMLIEKLKLYAPLFPEFLKPLLKQNAGVSFWKYLLKPFLTLSSLFGFSRPEFFLSFNNQFNELLEKLESYFNGADSNILINYIVSCNESLTILPKESLINKVDPTYLSSTLLDSGCIPILQHSGIVAPPGITGNICYITFSNPEEAKVDTLESDTSLNGVVRHFLSLARLVKLEVDKRDIHEYFRMLADFSSTDGNGDIEHALDKLTNVISKEMKLTDICDSLEQELKHETANDSLLFLSEYSPQNLYISKLKDVVASIAKNGLNSLEFNKLRTLVSQIFADPQSPVPSITDAMNNSKLFIDFLHTCAEKLLTMDPSMKPNDFLFYRNLCSILFSNLQILKSFEKNEELNKLDATYHDFISSEAENLLAFHQLDFLNIYREDRSRLKMFFEEFDIAFKCKEPFEKISHIHSAFQVLSGLLTLQGIGEIGADQIVPFAMVATVYSNPLGLASTSLFLTNFISPLMADASPLDHPEEYTCIQFCSTFQFVTEKIKEKGIQISISQPNTPNLL